MKLVWGPIYRVPPTPPGFEGSVQIFGRAFPVYNLFIIGAGPLVAIGLWLVLYRTNWGRMIRAASRDREMAGLVGINTGRLFTVVFVFGSWLGALGGALSIPVRSIAPGIGEFIIVEAFVVTVIGGLGSLRGAFIAAILVGILEVDGTFFFPEFEMAFIFLLMASVLIVRPWGLLGTRET